MLVGQLCADHHHSPPSDDTNGCPNCTVSINPTNFLKQLISDIPNDVVIISHAWLDIWELLAWSKDIPRRTNSRGDRIIQVIRLAELRSTLMPRGDRECYLCDTHFNEMVTAPDPAWQQPQATAKLAKLLSSATHGMQLNELTIQDALEIPGATVAVHPICCPQKSFSVMPNVSADRPPERPTYTAAHSLLISWEGTTSEKEIRTTLMKEALELLNYSVEILRIPADVGFLGYGGWVGTNIERFIAEHDAKGHLLVIYYIGHGGLDNRHLFASRHHTRDSDFDLTYIQANLQARCQSDVLLILDCCHAGHLPALTDDVYYSLPPTPDHTMETFAVCPSDSVSYVDPHYGFAYRLAGQIVLQSSQEDLTVDQYNAMLAQDCGKHRDNIRILHCGRSSILLERIQGEVD